MANRILPREVVDIITEAYHERFIPDYHEEVDEEVLAEMRYISPERIQRMPPEEIVDELIASGCPRYEVRDTKTLIHVLSVATGRTEDELRNAIFGVGDFDAKKFYQPTDLQKRVIRFVFAATLKLAEKGLKWSEFKTWPKEYQEAWSKLVDEIPDKALTEFTNDTKEYIDYYMKNGIPSWLY